jgi:hypothetical protein
MKIGDDASSQKILSSGLILSCKLAGDPTLHQSHSTPLLNTFPPLDTDIYAMLYIEVFKSSAWHMLETTYVPRSHTGRAEAKAASLKRSMQLDRHNSLYSLALSKTEFTCLCTFVQHELISSLSPRVKYAEDF